MRIRLSPREAQVVSLRITGMPARAIAATLNLSLETVRTYLKTAHLKAGVHNQIELVQAFAEPGRVSKLCGRGRVAYLQERIATGDRGSGCWPWPFKPHHSGYAYIVIDGKRKPVHRVALELDSGKELPRILHACHHCDNPICFNPSHLFSGTQMDNIKDMLSKGRGRYQSVVPSNQ